MPAPEPLNWDYVDAIRLNVKENVIAIATPVVMTWLIVFTVHGWWLAGQAWWPW